MKWLLYSLLFVTVACALRPLSVQQSRTEILANGSDEATFTIQSRGEEPTVTFAGDSRYTRLTTPVRHGDSWTSTLTASVNPGRLTILIKAPGFTTATRSINLLPENSDSSFLHLDTQADQSAFRSWFTFLAEVQYFNPPAKRPIEISDCSALLRYAYREALRDHNESWSSGVQLPVLVPMPSIKKYSYPHTPLGPNLFRHADGAFTQFANAESLSRFNCFFISRDITRAKPGDLLFFRRNTARVTYHSMIFLGRSHVTQDSQIYVVYHTGPEGTDAGEIRRLTVNQLLQFPDPQWHPIDANPSFLGIFRWNILKALS